MESEALLTVTGLNWCLGSLTGCLPHHPHPPPPKTTISTALLSQPSELLLQLLKPSVITNFLSSD